MRSVLALISIGFFAVLTYGFIQGTNLDRFHVQSCRTIYVPEDMDLSVALQSVKGLSIQALRARARDLGAKKLFVDKLSELDLKIYIIQKSISNEHIPFETLETIIQDKDKDKFKKRTKESPPVQSKLDILLQKPETTIQQLRKDVGLDD